MSNKLNCVIVDDEPMAREILTSFVEKTPNLNLIASCKSAVEALQIAQNNLVDLFFLDINMPEITGLSLAKIINKKSHIIFTTAYREYAVDGFDLQATDYLLKPISFDRFLQAIQRITQKDQIQQNNNSETENTKDFIFIRVERKMVKINFSDILYIESLSDYIKIHTQKETFVTRETISNIETKLPNNNFIRTHRSFIVSLSKISSYTTETIEIENKAIPISRSYKDSVIQKLAEV